MDINTAKKLLADYNKDYVVVGIKAKISKVDLTAYYYINVVAATFDDFPNVLKDFVHFKVFSLTETKDEKYYRQLFDVKKPVVNKLTKEEEEKKLMYNLMYKYKIVEREKAKGKGE